ncbi:hypothetical protein H9Q70_009255 [Fusarium xylarioides]|nr:hypothetical protein H9Q70_009255 [Fusarium xylarioides]
MAPHPTRRRLHEDVTNALQNAAKRRHADTQRRKEEQRFTLNAQGYRQLRTQLNEKEFLSPLDADTTKANIFYIKKKFMRRKPTKKKTLNQYWRDFKMLYRRANKGVVINTNDSQEIVKYINGDLSMQFRLDSLPKPKPVMGVDDLLLGLTHHWSRDTSVFPTEDDRLDLPTIMLFQAYSACRPAELVDGTKSRGHKDPLLEEPDDLLQDTEEQEDNDADDENEDPMLRDNRALCSDVIVSDNSLEDGTVGATPPPDKGAALQSQAHPPLGDRQPDPLRKHKALCYEDLTLWIVKDPVGYGRDVLAMEVYFRFHKGSDNKPKPTVFLFREHPLPMLCPISHILARALRDDAIQVNGYRAAEPFFSTRLGKDAVKVHWKSSTLKSPVFRKSIRTEHGTWTKSLTDPMKYATYAFYLDRIGRDLGSEEKWMSYCMRRGNANAIIGIAPDPVVDQVMRHDPMTGCLANAYLNHRVGFNVQDAYLERDPSADGLTRAFTHMSIRCNPEVPKEIPKSVLDLLPLDLDITELSHQIKRKAYEMKSSYRFIWRAPGAQQEEYARMRQDLINAEKRYRAEMTTVYQEACRCRFHDEELERQLQKVYTEKGAELMLKYRLVERTYLQKLLCDFDTNQSVREVTERKIRAINGMVALARRREVRRNTLKGEAEHRPIMYASEQEVTVSTGTKLKQTVPLILEKTQCIYCVGDERLSYADRTRKFSRVSHMMSHVENVHLRQEPARTAWVCHHPECRPLGDFLKSLEHFKHHVQEVHGVKLRE